MKIYIPTFRRINNQITFDNLPDEIKENVIMVVQEQEKDNHKSDCEYLIVDNDIGIAKTREIIYHHAGEKRFGVIDDDIKFYKRNGKYFKNTDSNMDASKRLMTNEDWSYWFLEIEKMFDEPEIMHLGHREVALPPMDIKWSENKMFIAVHWLDGKKLSKFINEVDWNYVQTGEDSVLAIECAIRGYKNKVSNEIVMDRWITAFSDGGCSEFRTAKFDEEQHFKLARKYPFVKVTNKYQDMKHIGRLRKFKVDIQSAYKSSQVNTLEEFL